MLSVVVEYICWMLFYLLYFEYIRSDFLCICVRRSACYAAIWVFCFYRFRYIELLCPTYNKIIPGWRAKPAHCPFLSFSAICRNLG